MKPLIIANLKSYKTASQYQQWLTQLKPYLASVSPQLVIAPAFPFFYLFTDLPVQLAAQNVSPFPPGSYTGEVNASQLKSLGVDYCLVGHSERRTYFQETSSLILNKINQLLDAQITPIVCVGNKNYHHQLSLIPSSMLSQLIFAFEPESSIGTNNPADPHLVNDIATTFLHAGVARVLYGGSVNKNNFRTYLSLPSISGLLISSYILSANNFLALLKLLSQ